MTTFATFAFLAGGLLDPNPGLIFWTTVTFALMLIILSLFAWKPMINALEAREKNIQSSIDHAQHALADAERILAENKAALAKANQESERILSEGKAAAEKLRTDILDKANSEARRMVESAKNEIAREKDAALAELRTEVADLAIKAAEKIILANLDAEKQKNIIAGVINGIGNGKVASPQPSPLVDRVS